MRQCGPMLTRFWPFLCNQKPFGPRVTREWPFLCKQTALIAGQMPECSRSDVNITQVRYQNVAGPVPECRRSSAEPSRVCVFRPNCDANRPLTQKNVAVQPFFADLRQSVAAPETFRPETCDNPWQHLQHSGPRPATIRGSTCDIQAKEMQHSSPEPATRGCLSAKNCVSLCLL